MGAELESYKQKRIQEATVVFNNNLIRLNSALAINVKKVRSSRIRNKQSVINTLINNYNKNVSVLKSNYNASVQKIQSFVPEFTFNKQNIKNKKALLIGINYLNTPYELSGCIDDANRMHNLLNSYGFKDIKMLTDLTNQKPTRDNILAEIK